MTRAMTTGGIIDSGTAVSAGRKKRKGGTAINASPKTNVDRTREEIKLIIRIKRIVNAA